MQVLQVRENVVGFEKALGAVKVIKDQIQYRSQSLLNLAREYFIDVCKAEFTFTHFACHRGNFRQWKPEKQIVTLIFVFDQSNCENLRIFYTTRCQLTGFEG